MWSMAPCVLCWRLAESDITVTPSVTCMVWLRWWYNHMADVVLPSTTLAFITKMSRKRKSASYSTIQVKNLWKTISVERKLDVISQLEKGEWIVNKRQNVRFTYISVCTVHDNAHRVSGTKAFVCVAGLSQSCWNELYQKLWLWVSYIVIALEVNKYIV